MPKTNGSKPSPFCSPEDLAKRKFLRASEFCIIYGRSRSWLEQAIRNGRIDSVKVGGSRMIPVAAAEKLFAGGQ